jgi:hypothetical protein
MARKKYWVRVKPSAFPGEKYSVHFYKKYGNYYGGALGVESKEELLKLLKDVFREWEGYDPILQRDGDRVTPGNLELEILAPDVEPDEIISLVRKTR